MKMRKAAAVVLILAIAISLIPTSFAEDTTIKISSAEDLIEFAQNCRTDTWSVGKVFEITCDIELKGEGFEPIPIFGGRLLGNGHMISGVNIARNGSYVGLFRYIQESGVVENLTVKGTAAPSGSAENVGGIAGENSGIIKNCTFEGEVAGKASVGGIAGSVTESGAIEGCVFKGSTEGKNYTGGIAGTNLGRIIDCKNEGSVNTAGEEESVSVTELDIDTENLRSAENTSVTTDSGGIAGYSKGRIESCTNLGSVGCRSVGYNAGGIAGRQSGVILNCENRGEINGRKDVGGIVGQAEPYVILEFDEDTLEKLDREMDAIQKIIDKNIDSTDERVNDKLDDINAAVSDIRDKTDDLGKDAGDYADDMAGSFNEILDRIHFALGESGEVFSDLKLGADNLADGADDLKQSADYLKDILKELDLMQEDVDEVRVDVGTSLTNLQSAMNSLADAADELEDVVNSLEDGGEKLRDALEDLNEALEKKENVEESFAALWTCGKYFADALSDAGTSLDDLKAALEEVLEIKQVNKGVKKAIANLGDLAESYNAIGSALGEMCDALLILTDDFDAKSLKNSLRFLEKGLRQTSQGLSDMRRAIDDMEVIMDDIETVSDEGKIAVDYVKSALDHMEDGADRLSDAMEKLEEIVNDLAQRDEIELPRASEYMTESFDNLLDAVETLQNEFTELNEIVREKKSAAADDMENASDKVKSISDILSDAYDKYTDLDSEDYYVDVSETESAISLGKIEKCANYGKVYADLCAGGAAGAMAIEYDFDPEDDVTDSGDRSLNFTYKTKCVVLSCVNFAQVESRKNYCGGICGKADLGSVLSCENYGGAESSDGDYVGGIVGYGASSIKRSAAKCTLAGGDYVGGVAGYAKEISSCAACVNIARHEEFAGSVAGQAEKEGVKSNIFVGNMGGIDDISYTSRAEEAEIEDFVQFVKRNFDRDVTFGILFVADGEEVGSVEFTYGSAIAEEDIPNVPEKKGYYGKWSEYDFENATYDAVLEAEYFRNMDIIASDAKREDGKSIVIVCGAFDDSAEVVVSEGGSNDDLNAIDSRKVEIKNSYNEKYTVRYKPLSGKRVNIYVSCGGEIEKVNTKSFGSYLEFEVSGRSFDIIETEKSFAGIIAAVIAGAALVLLCIGIMIVSKK